MADNTKFNRPWLIAVWPGMGHVAISAGYYLVAKLGMHLVTEFSDSDAFDVEHVEVKHGLIRSGRLPRNRLFAWVDPEKRHDLLVFVGEAQPPMGKRAFCQQIIEQARELGVERVLTFAAMATQMQLEDPSRVFGAATDAESLDELKRLEVDVLEDGQIGGLNGVLLGVAAEQGLSGACLLGEMPHIFVQLPFPKASLAVLKVFTMLAQIDLETEELAQQAKGMNEKLRELLANAEQSLAEQEPESPSEGEDTDTPFGQLSDEDRQSIERLFEQAVQDRSRAYELKRELDRLDAFQEYEDRFLDLFKNSD